MAGCVGAFLSFSMALMVTTIVLALVGGTAFTLWWWKIADRWADAEHKRFKVKEDPRPKVVVRSEPTESDRA